MTNTLEQMQKTPKTREDILTEKERGFELPIDEEREKDLAIKKAHKAFELISAQVVAENNID